MSKHYVSNIFYKKINLNRPYQNSFAKRGLDIFLSLFLIVLLFPVIALASLLIITESKGSFLFIQKRGGKGEIPFTIYKLRTLYHQYCDEGEKQVIHKDQRVTKVGKWLRLYRIDELPQLLNVLKGNMSLVGPRPHSIPMDMHYKHNIASYYKRFSCKPGITGLSQISNKNGEIRLIKDMEDRIALDIEYIQTQSLFLDLKILFRTCIWFILQNE